MGTVGRGVRKATKLLQDGYSMGLLGYPRVDNTFVLENEGYDMFPHPGLNLLNCSFEKLSSEEQRIKIDKKNILLFLSTVGVITPSSCDNIIKYLDYYLDGNLNFINTKKKKDIEEMLRVLEEYLQSIGLEDVDILKTEQEFARQSRKTWEEAELIKLDGIHLTSSSPSKLPLKGYIVGYFNKHKKESIIGQGESLRKQLERLQKSDRGIKASVSVEAKINTQRKI